MDTRSRIAALVACFALAGVVPAFAQAPAQALVDKGKTIFTGAGLCYACHGANAEGAVGPKLVGREGAFQHSDGSYNALVTFVEKGVPKEESKSGIMMPPRGGSKISDDDVKAVAAYVFSISRKKG